MEGCNALLNNTFALSIVKISENLVTKSIPYLPPTYETCRFFTSKDLGRQPMKLGTLPHSMHMICYRNISRTVS